ncbi:helix-turn-helix domain-containing protein [Bacillus velezensis]|uniref:helix-turn-helix domain-containing protein n=1 Tax=Bacillus velezensis TaxID=492670 RepID=UPI000BA7AC53|nr:helix-turn-helix transcriptional regulator [Bacillus velezensis]PAE74496.1 hypothetical protein CHH82_19545 [Bacillus velezensis]
MKKRKKRKWLSESRKSQGFTYDRLSEETGLARSFLWRIENGEADPSFDSVLKLSDALGFTPTFFYTQEISFRDEKVCLS